MTLSENILGLFVDVDLLGCNAVWTCRRYQRFGGAYCFHLQGRLRSFIIFIKQKNVILWTLRSALHWPYKMPVKFQSNHSTLHI
jgi:hypothetical protein